MELLNRSATMRTSRVSIWEGPQAMLSLENVNTYYGYSHILQGVSLEVRQVKWLCFSVAMESGRQPR